VDSLLLAVRGPELRQIRVWEDKRTLKVEGEGKTLKIEGEEWILSKLDCHMILHPRALGLLCMASHFIKFFPPVVAA
jgi:hypothetical protein